MTKITHKTSDEDRAKGKLRKGRKEGGAGDDKV
jgi:hypothetical protein